MLERCILVFQCSVYILCCTGRVNIRGTWNAVLGLVTVVVTIASAICMGLFLGGERKKGRNLEIKIPKLAWISNLLCAVWGILSFLAISRPNSTGKYTDNARQFVVAFVIGFVTFAVYFLLSCCQRMGAG